MRDELYESLINDAKQYENNKPQREFIFRVSQLHMCERRIMYGVLGYDIPGEYDGKSLLTLGIGTAVHEVVQGSLERNGYITNCEATMEWPEYSLNGHRDGDCFIDNNNRIQKAWIDDRTVNVNAIFELKTINAQGFMRLFWNRKPKYEHVYQVNAYMAHTGYKKSVLLYLNKNGITAYNDPNSAVKWPKEADQYVQSFVVDFDEELWYNQTEKLKRLNQSYNANIKLPQEKHQLPDKLPSGHKECTYCPYKPICKPPRQKKKVQEL